uniref:Uncharacterized protein n=1 Tax=Ignavibacterium album TaxID=591197 RepID=A0A832DJF0_9BACT
MYRFYQIVVSLIIILSISFSYSQTSSASGIKFNSQNVQINEKTSLFLNEGNPIELEKPFSISFDISFWDYRKFGPILRIEDSKGNEIKLIYVQFKNVDTSFIELIEPFHKNLIRLRVPKKNLLRNQYFNIKIEFRENKIILSYNDELKDLLEFKLRKKDLYRFAFGIKDLNDPIDYDVPAIVIKNIVISENNIVKYFWELNPFRENPLEDKINNSKIKALNPVWIYNEHQKWKLIASYKKLDNITGFLGAAFDSINSRFFIDCGDKLVIYDLVTASDSVINYKTTSPGWNSDLFYDHSRQFLYSFFFAMGKISIYDIKNNDWVIKDTTKNSAGHYYGCSKFTFPNDNDIYLLGGYGWYRTKNDLFKYDFKKMDWIKVALKKNEMTPRAGFSLGKGFRNGEFLIFGGLGNETGEQEKGFKVYSDLLLLNMNDSTIKKLNLTAKENLSYYNLYNYNFLDRTDSVLYFLTQIEEKAGNYFSLKKLDLKSGNIYPFENNFGKTDKIKWKNAFLYYSKNTDEFISILFSPTTIELYSINYPPISESEKTYIEKIDSEQNHLLTIVLLLIGTSSILLFYVYRKKIKLKISKAADANPNVNGGYNFIKSQLKNSIRLFGGLWIYDKAGNEISASLSPKLKEIFLLILIKSFNNHRGGITSEELSSIIWPDSSPESVKSNRGVAINKIRKTLSNVEGITLEFSDRLWSIKIEDRASCDYVEYLKYYSSIKAGKISVSDSLDHILQILKEGEFLKGISYEWLDSIKFAINNEVIELLKSFLEIREIKSNPDKIVRICDTILQFDSVDQDAVKLKIKTLTEIGKVHIAKSTFKLFIAEYKRLYDEKFPLSFEEFIS